MKDIMTIISIDEIKRRYEMEIKLKNKAKQEDDGGCMTNEEYERLHGKDIAKDN